MALNYIFLFTLFPFWNDYTGVGPLRISPINLDWESCHISLSFCHGIGTQRPQASSRAGHVCESESPGVALLPEQTFSQTVTHATYHLLYICHTDGDSPFKLLIKFLLPSVGPGSHGESLMTDVEKEDETQLDQQMHQEEHPRVHPKDGTRLTGRQLVLWRGLVLFGAILFLLVGILVRVCVRI